MLKLATVLVFLISTQLSSSTPTSISKRQSVHLCGSVLVEALSLVCGGEIYGPGQNNVKRDLTEEKTADYSLVSYLGFPESEKNELDSSPTVYRRQMEGIVEECCRNACSFSTLASYCAK